MIRIKWKRCQLGHKHCSGCACAFCSLLRLSEYEVFLFNVFGTHRRKGGLLVKCVCSLQDREHYFQLELTAGPEPSGRRRSAPQAAAAWASSTPCRAALTGPWTCPPCQVPHWFFTTKPAGLLNALSPPRECQLSSAWRWGGCWWAQELDCWSSVKAPATNPSSKFYIVGRGRDPPGGGLLKACN